MPLFSFEGLEPVVSPGAWIAPTATLVGDVRVEEEASVWYGAVLRADFGPIIIRRGANIQDGSVLHGGGDPSCEIGEGATIGHLCVVHGARVGAEALIGNGATVLDGAVIGSRALVAAGATVPPGLHVPDGMLAAGVPARVVGELTAGARSWVEGNPSVYRDLAKRHAASVRPVSERARGGDEGHLDLRRGVLPRPHSLFHDALQLACASQPRVCRLPGRAASTLKRSMDLYGMVRIPWRYIDGV